MKILEEPDTSWTEDIRCLRCSTRFVATEVDLQVSQFKQPDTYWFDGSADRAGLTVKFYVECPKCQQLRITPTDEVHILLQRDLKRRKGIR